MDKGVLNNPESDNELLRQLLDKPIKNRSIGEHILYFLSHPAWQGISAIFGLISLLVSVILTVYIFNITQEAEVANIDVKIYEVDSTIQTIVKTVSFTNSGPAVAKEVSLSVYGSGFGQLKTCNSAGAWIGVSMDRGFELNEGTCTIYIDQFQPGDYVAVFVEMDRNAETIQQIGGELQTEIRGLNTKRGRVEFIKRYDQQ
ncbi:hypothetical protein EKD04_025950 [Chloroflexales bacterium ZM16-3]|nr:hypothetical protein [Chloroflexales bacterium ZM16-3]